MPDVEFTPREQRMMALAWRCFDGEPKVNFQKLARLNGMTNTGSAYNAWTKIRKKLAGEIQTASPGNKKTTTKRTPKKRSRKDSDDDSEETPTKKFKGRKASLSSDLVVSSEDEVHVAKVETPEDGEAGDL